MMAFFKQTWSKYVAMSFFVFGQEFFFPKILEVPILQVLSSNLDPIEAKRGEER